MLPESPGRIAVDLETGPVSADGACDARTCRDPARPGRPCRPEGLPTHGGLRPAGVRAIVPGPVADNGAARTRPSAHRDIPAAPSGENGAETTAAAAPRPARMMIRQEEDRGGRPGSQGRGSACEPSWCHALRNACRVGLLPGDKGGREGGSEGRVIPQSARHVSATRHLARCPLPVQPDFGATAHPATNPASAVRSIPVMGSVARL